MTELRLVIGDKVWSSWSLRPWLAMTYHGIEFDEISVGLRQPDSEEKILNHSPSGKVPLLLDGELKIQDSLAILEYLAERFPETRLWPADLNSRAHARAISAEMHAGFPNIREELPMEFMERYPARQVSKEAAGEIERVIDIWAACLKESGPFLFGAFTAADAMYAPVVSRFTTYGITLAGAAEVYRQHIMDMDAIRVWEEGARAELASRPT